MGQHSSTRICTDTERQEMNKEKIEYRAWGGHFIQVKTIYGKWVNCMEFDTKEERDKQLERFMKND